MSDKRQTRLHRLFVRTKSIFMEHRFELMVFLGYVILAIVATYPLILDMNHSIYGYPGDSTGSIWYIWWRKFAIVHGLSPTLIPFVSAPFGADYSASINVPGYMFPQILIALVVNEIFAYNVCLILSFIIAGITMYYLARYLTKNRAAAAIAGLIFAFSPFHFAHAMGHLGIVMGLQWLPLYALCLMKLCAKPGWKGILGTGIVFAVMSLTDYYDGYIMGIFTAAFVPFFLAYRWLRIRDIRMGEALKIITATGAAIVLGAVMMIPFLANVFQQSTKEPLYYARPVYDLVVYSARPWDYVVPSVDNPFVGRLVAPFVHANEHNSNDAEQTLYLGFTTIILAGLALVMSFRRKRGDPAQDEFRSKRPFLYGLAFSAAAVLVVSAPPYWPIRGHNIPLFSSLAYKVVPMFRVYARFGVAVLLGAVAVAAFGITYIYNRLRDKGRIVLAVLLVCAVCLEFANFPPFHVAQVDAVAPVYRWLKNQPGNPIVAEYPLVPLGNPLQYDYEFPQRYHLKRIINGAWPGTKAESFRRVVEDVSKPATPAILLRLDVHYVIVHWDKYGKEKPQNVAPGLKLVRRFGAATSVYEIRTRPAELIMLPLTGFGDMEKQTDGSIWRWTGDKATLEFTNYTKETKTVDLNFMALAFAKSRTLLIKQAGVVVKRLTVPETRRSYQLTDLALPPGRTTLLLESVEKAQSIDSVLHNGDPRSISIMFSEFKLSIHEDETKTGGPL